MPQSDMERDQLRFPQPHQLDPSGYNIGAYLTSTSDDTRLSVSACTLGTHHSGLPRQFQ